MDNPDIWRKIITYLDEANTVICIYSLLNTSKCINKCMKEYSTHKIWIIMNAIISIGELGTLEKWCKWFGNEKYLSGESLYYSAINHNKPNVFKWLHEKQYPFSNEIVEYAIEANRPEIIMIIDDLGYMWNNWHLIVLHQALELVILLKNE